MTLRPLVEPLWVALLLLPALAVSVREAVLAGRHGRRPAARRWWLRAGAVLTAVGIGLGPSTARTEHQTVGVAVEMFFVVDRTGSMAAEDWGGTTPGRPRLEGVRHDLTALVAAVPGARYSIIAWDSEATRQLPLTTDAGAVQSWAQTVRQEVTAYSSGSLMDRPLPALAAALSGAAERNPGNVRLVFFLSDGEETTAGTARSYAELDPLVDGGAVLGYGTAAGGPMRSYDGSLQPDPAAPYIPDPAGQPGGDGQPAPAISRIDEARLGAVAEELGVPYVHRTAPDDVTALVAGLDAAATRQEARQATLVWTPVTWPLAAVLVLLLTAEAVATAREWQPLRRGRAGAR